MQTTGKVIGETLYVHWDALPEVPEVVREAVSKAIEIADVSPIDDFNVVKARLKKQSVSLLHYPTFFDDLFPPLQRAWTVQIDSGVVQKREYGRGGNPPILHRKELLLPSEHPRRSYYEGVSRLLEEAGLFEKAHTLGHKIEWQNRLALYGLEIHGDGLASRLLPAPDGERAFVLRHRTAIRRFTLSSPFQVLARAGLLDGKMTILDYGCGYGDDVASLKRIGISAVGWDPYFAPDVQPEPADIVNLGFVLNVIEDPREREQVLRHAYRLAKKILAVAVLRDGINSSTARRYLDGFVTRKQTFQKIFMPGELASLVERVLGARGLSGGSGIVLVARDPSLQRALEATRTDWAHGSGSAELQHKASAAIRELRESCAVEIWELILELGRPPEEDELSESLRTMLRETFRTLPKAIAYTLRTQDVSVYDAVRLDRRAELLGELAVRFIRRRRKLSTLPHDLQRDVRAFFGSFKGAMEGVSLALDTAASPDSLQAVFRHAEEAGLATMTPNGSLLFHSGNSKRLPGALQALLGCTRIVVDQQIRSDLTKINPRGPRITYIALDDFERKSLPLARQKIRVNLARSDANVIRLPLNERTPVLVRKSLFMEPEATGYCEQVETEQTLREALALEATKLWYPRGLISRGMEEEGLSRLG